MPYVVALEARPLDLLLYLIEENQPISTTSPSPLLPTSTWPIWLILIGIGSPGEFMVMASYLLLKSRMLLLKTLAAV